MSHEENKSSLWGTYARYFLAVVLFIASIAGGMALMPDWTSERPQTILAIDPAIQSAFFGKFANVRQPEAREVFPALDYIDADGNKRSLHVAKGEYVLLNVWASWCPPCIIELPDLERLQDRVNDDVALRVLPLSADINLDHAGIRDFLKRRGLWSGAANHDVSGMIMRNAPIQGLPTSFLLGENREILYIFEGAAPWTSREALEFFNSLPRRL